MTMKLVELISTDAEKRRIAALKRSSENAKRQLRIAQAREKMQKAQQNLNNLSMPPEQTGSPLI